MTYFEFAERSVGGSAPIRGETIELPEVLVLEGEAAEEAIARWLAVASE
jgi:hypothetical protein